MIQKFLNWYNNRPVKIIFENIDLNRFDKIERDSVLRMIAETYNRIHFSDYDFVVDKDFSNLDNVYLVIYYQLPNVMNANDLSRFKEKIRLKTPSEDMYYEGKWLEIYEITKKPAMIVVLLEYEIEKKLAREIVIPKIFNAGKI